MLQYVQSRYQESGDKHHWARAKMIEADHILSPPFSNPISLNLVLIEVHNTGHSSYSWDMLEADIHVGDAGTAGKLYDEAQRLFGDSSSPRGRAAVLSRLGCIDHLQS